MDLSVHTRIDETATIVFVGGEIDIACAASMRDNLLGALALDPPCLVVNLAGVEFMDCSGLRTLLTVRRGAELMKKCLYLTAVPDRVGRVIRLAGLDGVFRYGNGPTGAIYSHKEKRGTTDVDASPNRVGDGIDRPTRTSRRTP